MSRTTSAYPSSQKDTSGSPRSSSSYPSDVFTRRRISVLEDKYVRSTRYHEVGAGTSGTVTLPPESIAVLDSFGSGVDALVSTIDGGYVTFQEAVTAGGSVVVPTFDSSGNYTLSGTPSAYPVALIFRVRQKLKDFDSTSSDIIDIDLLESNPISKTFLALTDTPDSYAASGGKVLTVKGDLSGIEFSNILMPGLPVEHVAVDTVLDGSTNKVLLCYGEIEITLPDASLFDGSVYCIKNMTAQTVDIIDAGGNNIDAAATFSLALQYDSITVVATNGFWAVI